MEQFSQERDEEIHGWDDTTGKVVSKVIATPFSGTGGQDPLQKAPGRWRDDQKKQRN